MAQIQEEHLFHWLGKRVPEVKDRYALIAEEDFGYSEEEAEDNTFFLICSVFCPLIAEVAATEIFSRAKELLEYLEVLAAEGDSQIKNIVWFGLEDLPRAEVWKILGPTLKEMEIQRITSTPFGFGLLSIFGSGFLKKRYKARWMREIQAIGGFEMLTTEAELIIRFKLNRLYRTGLRSPKPGGEEWLSMGLRWPYPDR